MPLVRQYLPRISTLIGTMDTKIRPPSHLRDALVRAPRALPGRDSGNSTRFGGQETILLVDDMAAVREFATEALRSVGYRVIAVGTTDEAAAALADPSLVIDVLVTDVMVPSQGGEILSAEARRLRPGIKILLVSGQDGRLRVARRSEQFGLDFLAKPFGPEELAFRLRRLLDTNVASDPTPTGKRIPLPGGEGKKRGAGTPPARAAKAERSEP